MSRHSTISYELVTAAADSLKIKGLKPTSRAVRECLGAGSMGTINKLLQRWKAGQERQIETALALPPALQRAILEFLSQELSSARSTIQAELADQQQETMDLATENERQAAEIDAQAREIESLETDRAMLQGRVGQIEADLAVARNEVKHECAAAEIARTDLAKVTLRLEAMLRLEKGLEEVRAELKKERQSRIAAEQSTAVLAAQKTDLESRLMETKERADHVNRKLEQAQERMGELIQELADARGAVQAEQVAELRGQLAGKKMTGSARKSVRSD